MTAGRRTVYVTRDGATVRREGSRLRVFSRKEPVVEVTLDDLGQLVLMGQITLSPSALALLVNRGIDVVMLSHHGKYRGRIVSGVSGNVRLRLAQYRAMTDEPTCTDLARRIVAGKIHNQRALLLRHARKRPDAEEPLRRAALALRAILFRLRSAGALDEIRGCEGAASAAYFGVFDHLLVQPGFRFSGRNRRPPMDPVNALLSLGYTLLANQVEAAVHVVGLDPYLGSLHAPQAGRPSLVCDLQEEFRAPMVDALVIAAINQQAFKPDDFEDAGPGEPVILKRETLRWMVTLFERRAGRLVLYPPTGKKLGRRDIIEQQTRRLARHILGDQPYEAYALH